MQEEKDEPFYFPFLRFLALLVFIVMSLIAAFLVKLGFDLYPVHPKIIWICLYHATLCLAVGYYAKKQSGY